MKIIEIAGSGRSGSTLLAQLLSQEPGVFNLAQFRHLWLAQQNNYPCSCGHPIQDCEVYGQVFARGSVDGMHKLSIAFFKEADSIRDWSNEMQRDRLKGNHTLFLRNMKQLLENISRVTNSNTFVDASKIPSMALAFDLLGNTEVYVLNLARDPRAVACSWRKKGASLSAVVRFSRLWRSRQLRLSRWSNDLGHRFHLIKYEDYARSPVSELSKVENWAGLHLPETLWKSQNQVELSWDRQHLFPPANEKILAEHKELLTISASNSWRNRRNWLTHLCAKLVTGNTANGFYDEF